MWLVYTFQKEQILRLWNKEIHRICLNFKLIWNELKANAKSDIAIYIKNANRKKNYFPLNQYRSPSVQLVFLSKIEPSYQMQVANSLLQTATVWFAGPLWELLKPC